MDTVTLNVTIDRPREEVFAYLADVANHPEFSDHYLKGWRLTREESSGRGAGARYKQDGRFDRFGFYDVSFAEVDPPYRIIARRPRRQVQPDQDLPPVDARARPRRHAARVRLRDRAAAADRPASSRR